MAAREKSNSKVRNRLLAALPRQDLKHILASSDLITLPVRKELYEAGKPIQDVYFPEHGVVSLVTDMNDGRTLEVGTVGYEGMVGLAVFLGANSTPLRSFAQVEGDAWKLPAAAFRNVLSNGASALAQELHRYTQALFVQLSMSVACNRLHSLEKRCARWLLTTMDRVGADCFKLSHDFLAQMLGLRRPGTNAVLQKFKRRGILDYHNGEMNIKNRSSLESAACECYFIITKEYRRLTRV